MVVSGRLDGEDRFRGRRLRDRRSIDEANGDEGRGKGIPPSCSTVTRQISQTAKLLIEWYNPDLFVMTLQGIDLVHHDFWKYMDNPDSPYSNVLRDWYINMDDAVGELRKLVGANTNVLLLSDHGSAPVSSALFLNKYLES